MLAASWDNLLLLPHLCPRIAPSAILKPLFADAFYIFPKLRVTRLGA
jgi:hypothetical protein